ncbi:Bifunctional hemolysin/adenylate cyclase precursor [Pseudooceanicola marinus]|uniref:Bifunctional hemolysin/adenylate cyclase n=1 Tax=Pseudooceanicola marinus TaxID=396013 RepID=A0A1X6ZM27_9RHOB|nr:Bifunctional hemolysin/adenylate cyclase precursor [Pseudooceanicola marinus]
MGTLHFQNSSLLPGAGGAFDWGITDLLVDETSQGTMLYSLTRAGGGIASYALTDSGARLLETDEIGENRLQLTVPELELMEVGGKTLAAAIGLSGEAIETWQRQENGTLTWGTDFASDGLSLGQLTELEVRSDGAGGAWGYGALSGGGLVRLDLTTGRAEVTDVARGGPGVGHAESDLLMTSAGGTEFVVATYATADAITVYRVEADGGLTRTADIGAGNGIWIDAPTAVADVTAGGERWLVVASAGSSSLTVMRLGADGSVTPTDHVIDDLSTRFQSITTLETVEVGGRAYVLVGGADDGVTLFELLPNGELFHHCTIADRTDLSLANVGAIAAAVSGNVLTIFAAGEGEAGITRTEVDLSSAGEARAGGAGNDTLQGGALDDALTGGAGHDLLRGGAGDDILVDGTGRDTLQGDAGADVFALSLDGETDVIADFERGTDRLDLSRITHHGDTSRLLFVSRDWGGEFHIGDEVIEVHSADGDPLSASDFGADTLYLLSRLSLDSYVPGEVGRLLEGSEAADLLHGGGADDTIRGLAAADRLYGGDGDDKVFGDAGNDRIHAGNGNDLVEGGTGMDLLTGDAGFDTLYGGGGGDFINGGGQADRLYGDGGDDRMLGEAGQDNLYGGSGTDRLIGGDQNDRLYGGEDDDQLRGGIHEDRLYGDAGQDVLFGDGGFDHLEGGSGDDLLYGGNQADNLFGGIGNDAMYGDAGFDRLFTGAGDDLAYGGDGPDALFGEQGNDRLYSGTGGDRIWAGAGNDTLYGGSGDDELAGGAGFDRIDSGAGDDRISGNFNADVFVFADGFGDDTITDFDALNVFEKIDLSEVTAITDFDDLIRNHAFDVGGAVLIAGANGDQILLQGVAIEDLDAGDFIF